MRALHLLALASLAIAQPLLDLLSRYAELFVARRSEPLEIVALPLALVCIPPLVLWLVVLAVERLSPSWGRGVYASLVALLVAGIALPLLKTIAAGPATGLVLAALALGAAGAWAVTRLRFVRTLVAVMAVGPVLYVGAFFASPSILALLFGDAAPMDGRKPIGQPTSIVMVVFDELPLASLLDVDGEIDAQRYPNFARLAATSSWLRNATTVESRTLQAIPALVTGRYPSAERRLPLASQHPGTLFELLDGRYRMNVNEALTNLYETGASPREPFATRWNGLIGDVSLVYFHFLLPESWAQRFPSVRQTWRDFAAGRTDPRRSKRALRGRPLHFRRFVESLRAEPSPSLDFIHVVLPHGPWQYLPSGASFHPFRNYGRFLGYWSEEPYFAIEGYRRHLLQVELVDRLLGELLDRLEALGTFDRTLLVVAADHGASFWPGDHYRHFQDGEHPADILSVPLFIKRPGQTRGDSDRRNVEIIDVLPTLLDVIDHPVPDDVDGCSIFDPACPERREKVAFSAGERGSTGNRRHRFDANIGLETAGLQRKHALLAAHGAPDEPYRGPPYASLVGRSAEELAPAAGSAGVATLAASERTWQIERSEALVGVRLVADLDLGATGEEPPQIAVALDGRIETVVPAPRDETGRRLVAMLPESRIRGATPALSLYQVSGPAESPRLQSLELERP